MKRIFSFLAILALIFVIAACSSKQEAGKTEDKSNADKPAEKKKK